MAQIQFYLILFLVTEVILGLNGNYIGIPKNPTNLRAVLNKNFTLKCNYNGSDEDGQFSGWYQDGQLIDTTGSDRFSIVTTAKQSKLMFKLVESDQNVREWSVRTNKPGEENPASCRFSGITLLPSPHHIETDRDNETIMTDSGTVKRQINENITLKCILAPNSYSPQRNVRTKWHFSENGKTYGDLPSNVQNIAENDIVIEKINKNHRGYYRCTRNKVSFTVRLHVKDRFAALWPFIGIVSTVIVLVIGILLLEKHQKAKKQALAAEDGTLDQANNPLVPTAPKTVDDANKKSTENV